ncbi:MAG: hypothetical protein IPI77_19635 [Saprospiraceae bacterium]|nr:hypothetical protein [Saprospiraceae bacterium]
MRKHETIKPVKWLITPEGDTVLDFGQNMVGWVKKYRRLVRQERRSRYPMQKY